MPIVIAEVALVLLLGAEPLAATHPAGGAAPARALAAASAACAEARAAGADCCLHRLRASSSNLPGVTADGRGNLPPKGR